MGVDCPRVSIIIPTLNAASVLRASLISIALQQTADSVEVLVVDAGSTDGTQAIATQYGARVLENPLRTAEAGKAVGVQAAHGEFLAFVDSDNILVGNDWLARMLAPFQDADVVATEPDRYLSRPNDGYLTRYFAGLGMSDPICLFLGNYDRYCVLTGRWTDLAVRSLPQSGYDKVWLSPGRIPTIGANGFVVRRQQMLDLQVGKYVFDVDIVHRLVAQQRWAFAKVHCGVVHVFAGDVRTFQRKQRRRVRDFLYFRQQAVRSIEAQPSRRGLIRFVVATVVGWPLVWQALGGFCRTGDAAWFFHPAACALTLYEYGTGMLAGRRQVGPLSREGWRQC